MPNFSLLQLYNPLYNRRQVNFCDENVVKVLHGTKKHFHGTLHTIYTNMFLQPTLVQHKANIQETLATFVS